jgi:hypothetical protein
VEETVSPVFLGRMARQIEINKKIFLSRKMVDMALWKISPVFLSALWLTRLKLIRRRFT